MTKVLQVFKFSAAGNDFVLVDLETARNRWPRPRQYAALAKCLSGNFNTDGVLYVRAPRLVFLNPDGSRAFCGNGTRTAGYYLVTQVQKKKNSQAKVLTDAGPIRVKVQGDSASLRDVEAPKFLGQRKIGSYVFHKVWSGCPHAVAFAQNLRSLEVDKVGRGTRYDPHFHPEGTNVDFVKVLNKTTFEMRVYERGVEKETLSCGSGVLAAGFLMKRLNRLQGDNFLCKMRGGDFKIGFDNQGRMALTSQVKMVFKGEAYV